MTILILPGSPIEGIPKRIPRPSTRPTKEWQPPTTKPICIIPTERSNFGPHVDAGTVSKSALQIRVARTRRHASIISSEARLRRQVKQAQLRADAVGATGVVTYEDWIFILKRQNWVCAGCSVAMKWLTMDHIQPLVRGGVHTPENVQAMCRPCNSRKGTSGD